MRVAEQILEALEEAAQISNNIVEHQFGGFIAFQRDEDASKSIIETYKEVIIL